jgi:hypothetical protein
VKQQLIWIKNLFLRGFCMLLSTVK